VESVSSASNEPYDYWVPTGSATARLDVASRWWLNGGYRRDFSVLQGLTDELYTTDTAFLATGGIVNSRVTMQVGGTFNNGQTPVASGVSEDFTIYGASLQTRVALTSTVSAFAGYFYYRHRYSNPAALPRAFPGVRSQRRPRRHRRLGSVGGVGVSTTDAVSVKDLGGRPSGPAGRG